METGEGELEESLVVKGNSYEVDGVAVGGIFANGQRWELWREKKFLSDKLLREKFQKWEYIRNVYGEELEKLGEEDERIVALTADLAGSTKVINLGKKFPNRFFNFGVAEQNMMDFAVGLAKAGFIPFVSTFAIFATGRAWEQVRQGVCYNEANVKIVSTHGGITVGEDGATHQALEDISVMRCLPKMRVIVPADPVETRKVIREIVKIQGPFYVRLSREKFPYIFDEKYEFKLGKGFVLRDGKDCAIISCGIMTAYSLIAADILKMEGIDVLVANFSSIKPIDEDLIVSIAKTTGAIVTAEEHSIIGGLGSAVTEVVVKNYPVPMEFVGMKDSFGMSGPAFSLLKYFSLSPEHIAEAVRKVLKRK